jgi:hypothetical protein
MDVPVADFRLSVENRLAPEAIVPNGFLITTGFMGRREKT